MKKLWVFAAAFLVASTSFVAGASARTSGPCTADPTGSITRLYRAYFLRAPDGGGLAFWVDRCNRNISRLADISDAFAASDEFKLRYGSVDNPAFVNLVYRNVLGRIPDAGGLQGWLDFMTRGARRGEVMLGFSESPEFQAKVGVISPVAPTPAPAKLTAGQTNAIRSAQDYLRLMAFSRAGLIEQLSSPYGEGYSVADATFAVDSLNVDWNEQAAKKAKEYLAVMPFSRAGLIEQLSSPYGEGFTYDQAVYGVNAAGL
ncbi:MAG TPA: Ltp family lipoprotein [Acidimicrobiales bacterium]|nr:Ltp family lipoprotein [Acidimicrobiales bacterium]